MAAHAAHPHKKEKRGRRDDLNGQCIQAEGHPEIYLVHHGKKWHIPDADTFNHLFKNWDKVKKMPKAEVDAIPAGKPLTGAHLLQENGKPEIYLAVQGKKHHITSPAVMDKYHFDGAKVKHVDTAEAKKFHTKQPLM